MILCPRFHLFEINDQPWWPPYLRAKVQDCLTLAWTFRVPLLQSQTPASLVASTLTRVLGPTHLTDYIYVDFASGAGGPTPEIERLVNQQVEASRSSSSSDNGDGKGGRDDGEEKALFVLTDLRPHLSAWQAASKKSENLRFVAESVDAADAPRDLVEWVMGGQGEGKIEGEGERAKQKKKKVMRLFSLAFHHFDDELAERILRNTVECGDGFAIFELQSRTPSSLLTVFLFGPLIAILTPFFFWRSPLQLAFTYLVPLIPFCLVYDGYVSSLRTRTPDEVERLLRRASNGGGGGIGGDSGGEEMRERRVEGYRFVRGQECHTWPTGWMGWVVCVKE